MKYFAYDPESGFDTYDTKQQAIESASQSIEWYRDNAGEGWMEEVENVCWGEIKQESNQFQTSGKIQFEGELVDAVDYKLKDL